MSEVTFGSDGDFSHERMIQRVNTNLANEFGNLVQRTLSMVFKNCDKAVPLESEIGPYTPEDEALLEKAKSLREQAGKHIASQSIHKYAETMITMIWESNKYIDNQAPWILRKTDTDRMKTVLYVLLEVLRYSAILYQPLIPTSANKILDLLIVPEDERTFDHLTDDYKVRYGAEISKPEGVFPRLELPEESVVA